MNSNELPLNTPVVITNTELINVVMTRTSEEDAQVIYRNPATSDIVMDIRVKINGSNNRLEYFDRFFWTITVDGCPVTEGDFEDLARKPNLNFNVDPSTRALKISIVR